MMVKSLAQWTPDQTDPGSKPTDVLNFRVSEVALSTAT